MEACLCFTYLNHPPPSTPPPPPPHSFMMYSKHNIAGLQSSWTEYLPNCFQCSLHTNINFRKVECINGQCNNNCKMTDVRHRDYDWDTKVSYVFQKVPEFYINKIWGRVSYHTGWSSRRTSLVVWTSSWYGKKYISHRYHVNPGVLEKFFLQRTINMLCGLIIARILVWPQQHVVWLDYSQDISLTTTCCVAWL